MYSSSKSPKSYRARDNRKQVTEVINNFHVPVTQEM